MKGLPDDYIHEGVVEAEGCNFLRLGSLRSRRGFGGMRRLIVVIFSVISRWRPPGGNFVVILIGGWWWWWWCSSSLGSLVIISRLDQRGEQSLGVVGQHAQVN